MLKFEVLQEKPWYLQLAAFGSVGLLLFAGFWYFITSGTREETQQVEEQVAKLQQDNARAQIASQRLNEFKVAYARTQADYDDLKALLPEQRELTTVLQGVQDRARGRLTVRRFTPKDDVQQDFYSGKPIEVEVTAKYNDVGQFFAQMAAYQRIVSISDFKIVRLKDNMLRDKGEGKTIDAQFLLTAYYVSPEKLQTVAPAPAAATVPAPPAAPTK
ncbi:MAG TPA: type 4a pilus biogenesis protein PilO [Pyrinomonadaceae bacterium]|jgi:type IV pilus assembly protein PilO|nr:type 4a pilus biogenesis protein PilO [Pyrinomonadaceae bacterium]